jgi:putative tryptophan/tyrosine transport system substrate-binding protein
VHADGLRRREFITLVGGATVGLPLVAHAQQPKIPVIGYLHSASPEPYTAMIAAFKQGLSEGDLIDGQSVRIEYRWAEGKFDRLPALAAELVERKVDVLVAGGGDVSAQAAQQQTKTIPIAFTIGGDPVKYGLVKSLNRPGGNVTGVTFFTITLGPKRLELLRELVPMTKSIAMLVNPASFGNDMADVEAAARQLGLKTRSLNARNEQDIDIAFRDLARQPADALIIISNPLFTSRREQIVTLANHHRIPTIYSLREFAAAGGLVSYGASIGNAYRQTGVLAGRILKGAKPADLPVQQPSKFELVINLKTAKALGLTVPPHLLARADEVIE